MNRQIELPLEHPRVPYQKPACALCKMAFVGEAPGFDEVVRGEVFVGPSGKVLNKLFRKAAIERADCLITNVFDYELPNNNIKSLCVEKKNADTHSAWPQLQVPVERGAYVPASVAVPALERLNEELEAHDPNIIVALGGTAVWALLEISPFGAMKKMRGTLHEMPSPHGFKVLITYHPAYVLRNYSAQPIVLADIMKAKRESEFPELRVPEIDIRIPEKAQEVEDFLDNIGSPAAVDIETVKGQIDNIGFADCFERAMSVPIFNAGANTNYWPSAVDEARVLDAIARYLANPNKKKIFQNGNYDVQWLWEKWRIAVRGRSDDTRLLHHALWPELPKDLGTIASLHLNMPAWKLTGAGRASTKKED